MIIGVDASRANREAKTGTEWYSYNLILALAKIDSRNRYFLYSPSALRGKLATLPQNFRSRVLAWPPRYLWSMLRLSGEMCWHSPTILFVPAHIIPLLSPSRTITTIMDIGFVSKPELYPPRELKYHNFGLRQAIKKASKIITISDFTKQEMVRLCAIDPHRITVIHLGFDARIFQPVKNPVKIKQVLDKYHLSFSTPYFLYIGRLEEKKNTLGLVRAFGEFKRRERAAGRDDYKLILAGSPGHHYERVRCAIEKQNLSTAVIETGWVMESDLPVLLSHSRAFVFPSFYEGFGLPLLEAMSCQTPILASNVAAIPEVTGRAAYLFNPYRVAEIAAAMEKIAQGEDLRQQLINAGIKRVRDFSWERCARETLRVIEES